jgi:hypothetical protein
VGFYVFKWCDSLQKLTEPHFSSCSFSRSEVRLGTRLRGTQAEAPVAITTASNDHAWAVDDVATDEIVRRYGVTPILSAEDLDASAHPELWDSDTDYEAFLADVYAARRADIG